MILCETGYQTGTSKRAVLYQLRIGDRIRLSRRIVATSCLAATPMARSRRGGALEVDTSSSRRIVCHMCVRASTRVSGRMRVQTLLRAQGVRRNGMQVDPHPFRLKRDFDNPIRKNKHVVTSHLAW